MQQQSKILVVEDEPLIRMAIAEMLLDEGYLVLEASNVLEAIGQLMKDPDVDIVFTDIDMPGGRSGLDLLKLVRQSSASIGLAATSGGHNLEPADLAEGAVFIPKPYSFSAVSSILQRLKPAPVPVSGTRGRSATA